jgi:hypothetical protein
MTNAYFGCHSERKRGIFLDVKTHGGLKMNHYPQVVYFDFSGFIPRFPRAAFASVAQHADQFKNHVGEYFRRRRALFTPAKFMTAIRLGRISIG